jgi:TonB family protein
MDDASENYAGSEPALHRQLNELSRLYIRHSDYARAEPVLERLLQMARARGDRHPDVATALAGLAVAKRGLGDVASAEQLYRQALKIREDVLAPHHMAIVVTLEQLAETCADRGKLAEALVHLQRALLRRERALGAEHASAHTLRARIAELELRRQSIGTVSERASAPPQRPGELAFLFQPRSATAPLAQTASIAPMTPTTNPALPERSAAAPSTEHPVPNASVIRAPSRGSSRRTRSRRRTTRFASVGAAVVVLAGAGFRLNSAGPNEAEYAPVPSVAERHRAILTPASNAGSLATVDAGAPESESHRSQAAPLAKVDQPAPAAELPTAMPTAPVAPPNLRRLVVPKVATPSVDSLMRAAVKPGRDTDADQITARGGLVTSAQHEDASVTPPVLITAPTLRFPEELRAHRVEGEVVVQLRVDEKGRVDPSSMRVMHSEHELFTATVRSALPRFRFEPARSAAPESKPQSAWVQFRAQFTTRS